MEIQEILQQTFPIFHEQELRNQIAANSQIIEAEPGTVLLDFGSYIKIMPLVIEGSVKVMRKDEDGNELFLYYLNPGETCAMTLSCCMANKPSEVRAIAEENTKLLAIPSNFLEGWMQEYQGWKNFVMITYNSRFDELLHAINDIAFLKMDERLMKYLHNKVEVTHNKVISTTHQVIADDLNSSREVVSRLLKQLERMGRIKLSRNHVELLGEL